MCNEIIDQKFRLDGVHTQIMHREFTSNNVRSQNMDKTFSFSTLFRQIFKDQLRIHYSIKIRLLLESLVSLMCHIYLSGICQSSVLYLSLLLPDASWAFATLPNFV